MSEQYPDYDVLAGWDGPSYNDVTRAVLAQRLHDVPERRFFDANEFALLEALCARLIPQPDRTEPIPLAPFVDATLADGNGDGFRKPGMPMPSEIWRIALAGIEAEAQRLHGCSFTALDDAGQNAVLTAVQRGDVAIGSFGALDPTYVFTHTLLKTVAGIYYSHPTAWSEIGFGGPASPRGYVRIALDRRDPWEAPLVPR